ncbi:MAG: hypothetical protein FJ023_02135 [Chloroflexi bacterium]|nr:hypothetical protein [Chloroflexota bacterium]
MSIKQTRGNSKRRMAYFKKQELRFIVNVLPIFYFVFLIFTSISWVIYPLDEGVAEVITITTGAITLILFIGITLLIFIASFKIQGKSVVAAIFKNYSEITALEKLKRGIKSELKSTNERLDKELTHIDKRLDNIDSALKELVRGASHAKTSSSSKDKTKKESKEKGGKA